MLIGVHTVLKDCISGWEACVHFPHESIKPAPSVKPQLANMLVAYSTLFSLPTEKTVQWTPSAFIKAADNGTEKAAQAHICAQDHHSHAGGLLSDVLFAAFFSQRPSNAPNESKLEPQLNHGRVVLSILWHHTILRGGQGVKQASEGLDTAQSVGGHQLFALQPLVLQAGFHVPACHLAQSMMFLVAAKGMSFHQMPTEDFHQMPTALPAEGDLRSFDIGSKLQIEAWQGLAALQAEDVQDSHGVRQPNLASKSVLTAPFDELAED